MKNHIVLFFLGVGLVHVFAHADEPKTKPIQTPKPKPKPQWQYESNDIRIPIPTAEEPRVKEFNADTIRAASKYLDEGAVAWLRERKCIACHTPGAYMLDRPILTKHLGKPNEEVLKAFVDGIQEQLPPTKEKQGVTYYALAERAVWRAAGWANDAGPLFFGSSLFFGS